MTCSTKRRGSENWYYRRRIPTDVQAILAGMPKSRRPENWSAAEINISLGTADREVAKAKCPEIAADVERAIAAFRAGPQPLSQKQISALSGELYFVFARGLEDNPDLTPEGWLRVAIWNDQARDGRYGTGPIRIGKGVVIRTVINGMTFDGATKDPVQMAVRDALIAFMAATAQAHEGSAAGGH